MRSTTASTVLPAPRVIPEKCPTKWQREYEAFQRLLPQLLGRYRDQYVLVHDGEVVDSGPDDLVLALRFFAQHGNIPVHIGLVTDQQTPVARMPHYRERVSPGSSK